MNNEVLKYYYKYTTELKAASSAETKVVKKHKRQLNSKQQEVYNQIDALNVQSDLDSIKQSIERIRLQLSDIIYLIDTVDGVLENKLTLFKEDITAKDETTETLLQEILQDKKRFYDLKDKARKQVEEVEQLIQDVQKPLTDSNVKEAREIANRIKQISVSIIGDANTGKKGITAEIHDLKEKLLKNNEKYIQIWLDEDANKIYLEIEALKIDFNRTYRRIQIIHEDLLSILKNIEHESTDEICEKKKSRNDIIDKITPIIGIFAECKSIKEDLDIEYKKIPEAIKNRDINVLNDILSLVQKNFNRLETEDGLDRGLLGESEAIYDVAVDAYNKHKSAKGKLHYAECDPVKTTSPSEYQYVAEEKADEWPTPAQESTKSVEEKDNQVYFEQRKTDIVGKISTDLKSGVKIGNVSIPKRETLQPIYFYYDDEQLQRFFIWANEDVGVKNIEISNQLAYILGFELHGSSKYVQINSFAKYTPDLEPIHSMYIYSPNLVSNTVIGNSAGPLLRIVNVTASSTLGQNKVVENIYTQEFHHQVIQKYISEIRIEIRSDSGRLIEFNSGNCILTLHFKRSFF